MDVALVQQNAQDGKGGADVDIFLQDAKVTLEAKQSFYTQLVLLIRQMYQECRLVHADLSEYNILVHEVSSPVIHPCLACVFVRLVYES